MSIVSSSPVNALAWSNTWIFFMAAILGLTVSLCFILTVCTCRTFFYTYSCDSYMDEEYDSDTLSWIAQQENNSHNKVAETDEQAVIEMENNNGLERQHISHYPSHQVVHEQSNPSSSLVSSSSSFGKGRRVVGLKTVVIDYWALTLIYSLVWVQEELSLVSHT